MSGPDAGVRAPGLLGAATIGLAAGIAALALGPGPAMLGGHPALSAPPRDWAMALSGVIALLSDDWRWPLGATETLAETGAVRIFFTDSMPLFAVLWKAAGGPAETGPILASWLVILFAAQGAAGATALRLLGLRSAVGLAAGALIVALWPAFLWRVPLHLALSAHAIVVLAVAMALAPIPDRPFARMVGWAALLAVAALTHAYLLAMALVGLGLSLLGSARGRALALTPLVLLPAAGALGALGALGGAPMAAGGYGYYRLDLAAPIAADGGSRAVTGPTLPPGADDGHSYVPLAVWALAVLALALAGARRPGPPQSILATGRGASAAALTGLGLVWFATAGRIGWAGAEIATIAVPTPMAALGEIFRAAGRFVWPVGYALLLMTLARAGTGLRRGPLLLGVAAALVVVELAPRRGAVLPKPGLWSGDMALARAIAASGRVASWPVWGCDPAHIPALDKEVQFLAARSGARLANGVTAARAARDCAAPLPEGVAPVPEPGTVAIVKHAGAGLGPVARLGIDPDLCGLVPGPAGVAAGGLALCAAAPAADVSPMPRLSLPAALDFSDADTSAAHLGAGFARTERWGVWSLGPLSVVEIAPVGPPSRLSLTIRGFVPPERPETSARLVVSVRRRPSGPWEAVALRRVDFRRGAGPVRLALPGPDAPVHRLRLTLRPEAPLSPASFGRPDPRRLGVGLIALRLE